MHLLTDIDECAAGTTACVPSYGGTCMNLPDGNYYTCSCAPGYESNGGDASMGTLGCQGIYIKSEMI